MKTRLLLPMRQTVAMNQLHPMRQLMAMRLLHLMRLLHPMRLLHQMRQLETRLHHLMKLIMLEMSLLPQMRLAILVMSQHLLMILFQCLLQVCNHKLRAVLILIVKTMSAINAMFNLSSLKVVMCVNASSITISPQKMSPMKMEMSCLLIM